MARSTRRGWHGRVSEAVRARAIRQRPLLPVALAACLVAGLAWAPAALATPGPVASWGLDGDATEAADAALDGTLLGGSWVAGHAGQALAVATAGDGVVVNNAPALEPAVLTLEAWVRASATPAAGASLIAKGVAGCDGPAFGLRVGPGGGIELVIAGGAGSAVSAEAPTTTWDDAWHHVAGTYDGTNLRLYVDGAETGTAASAGGTAPGYEGVLDNGFRIGASLPAVGGCDATPPFAGAIDDVRLWDRALSAAEIAARAGGTTVATTTVLGLPPAMQVGTLTAVSAAIVPVPVGGSVDFVDVTDVANEEILATAPVTADGVALAQIRFPLLGARSVVARYSGAATFAGSESDAGSVGVERYLVAPGEARLGDYAFNDAITASLRDPASGVTYVGGPFTELGRRTGPVAEVEPPGTGPGALLEGSPEVVGQVRHAVPDGDGYLLFGDLIAVNGAAVPVANGYPTPIVRIDAGNQRDPAWNANAKGLACTRYGGPEMASLSDVDTFGNYVVLPVHRSRVQTNASVSTTGIALLDRTTGAMYLTGQGSMKAPDGTACPRMWSSIPPLPPAVGCDLCYADIRTVTVDSTSGVLLVSYGFSKGSGSATTHSLVLAGYSTTLGTRLWSRTIVGPDPKTGAANVTTASPLPGAFLLTGAFPIETSVITWQQTTTTMLIDALTGATRQRWTVLGEVSLADPLGDPSAPSTTCLPAHTNGAGGQASVSPSLLATLGGIEASTDTTTTHTVCTYALDGNGKVIEATLGSAVLQRANGTAGGWPVWTWEAGDGTRYLLGPNMAFDLDAGHQVTWNADPSNWSAYETAMLQVGDRLILTGPFRFLHGTPARHLAAMDPSQEPLAGFDASLGTPAEPYGGVAALALWSGRLVVAGDFAWLSGEARDGLGAIDPVTGAADPWTPDASGQSHPAPRSIAVDPDTDDLYVAGASCRALYWECPDVDVDPVVRYTDIDDGGAIDPAFSPVVACNPAGYSDVGITTCPNVRIGVVRVLGGDVYLAGEFTKVDGTPRQGLARLGKDGTLRAWAPTLFTQMDPPPGGELFAVSPHELLLDANRVIVSGTFQTWVPFGGGAGAIQEKSYVVAYSATTGTRIYPAPSGPMTGPPSGVGDGAFDAAIYGSALVVAVGRRGAMVLDRATFAFDPTANPYLVGDKFWASNEGVFSLADDPAALAAVSAVTTPAASEAAGLTAVQAAVLAQTSAANEPVVATFAGAIPRWGLRTAGNLLEVGLRAPDVLKPVAFAPRVVPSGSSAVTSTVQPATVTWPAAVETGSGLSRYQVQRSVRGKAWATITLANPKATSFAQKLTAGTSYRYRVRAVDKAGNASAWILGSTVRSTYLAEGSAGVRTTGSWTTRSMTGAVGRSVRSTTATGATARVSVSGRAVGVVMALGPGRGSVAIYLDGKLAGTVSLKASTMKPARVVFMRTLGAGTHTILVKSLGPARVDLDGFVVIR